MRYILAWYDITYSMIPWSVLLQYYRHEKILQRMISCIPLYWPFEPEGEIFAFMWSLGPLHPAPRGSVYLILRMVSEPDTSNIVYLDPPGQLHGNHASSSQSGSDSTFEVAIFGACRVISNKCSLGA